MKRILCILLALLLPVGLCACHTETTEKPAPATFWAGFGSACITPNYSVPLAGYGNSTSRMSQGFLDYSYAICTAIRDETGSTVLLVVIDLNGMADTIAKELREAVTAATGIPGERIMLSATHTHSAPDVSSNHSSIVRYMPFFKEQVVKACTDAVADLAPASVQTGAVEVEGMNFVRHYLMNDGTYAGDNFGSTASGYKAHEREADKQLQVVRFIRPEQGKQDILLVSWQAHPKLASNSGTLPGKLNREMLSADYVGFMRTYVADQTGCQVVFYQGSAGNINPLSNILSEQTAVSQDPKEYGQQLGQWVLKALENMTEQKAGPVATKQVFFEVVRDHTEDHLREQAQKIVTLWNKTNDYNLCAAEGAAYGIASPYHAVSIVNRFNCSAFKTIELNAISIGGVGFVTAPYEMFCQNGQAIKAGSPFDTTVIITHCNGSNSYIAADAAFEYGSYEVHNRLFVRGTAEQLQNQMVLMLKEVTTK